MIRSLLYIFFFLTTLPSIAQRTYDLYSPDSSLRLQIKTQDKLSWHLYAGKELLTQSSSIGLQLKEGKMLSGKLAIASHKYNNANEIITVPVPYRKKTLVDNYNQLELTFKEPFSLQFRMYNNGMAYRIGVRFKDSIIVESENVTFELNENTNVWFAHMDKRQNVDRFHTSFEAIYKKQQLSAIPDTMLTYSPVTVSLANGYHLAICDTIF